MDFNIKNMIFSGTAGGVIGLALTMESQPELAGVLLGSLLGVISLYANHLEKSQSLTE